MPRVEKCRQVRSDKKGSGRAAGSVVRLPGQDGSACGGGDSRVRDSGEIALVFVVGALLVVVTLQAELGIDLGFHGNIPALHAMRESIGVAGRALHAGGLACPGRLSLLESAIRFGVAGEPVRREAI